MTTEIFISAGEASGDLHAAKLVKALHSLNPDIHVFGMGGSAMREAGVETIIDAEKDASVMGFVEVVSKFKTIINAFNYLCAQAKKKKPALAILLDFPDFNLRLAERMHAFKIPVMYYISPQVWAWRTGRIKNIKKYVSKMVPILPFEEDFYKLHGVDADYLGHPLLDTPPTQIDRNQFCERHDINPDKPILAVLPGSRKLEIIRILPTMAEALKLLRDRIPELQAVIPVAPTLTKEFIQSYLNNQNAVFISKNSNEVMQIADATLVTSGTACLEAALNGKPFTVVYKANPLSYKIARWFVGDRVKWIALPNLIAQQTVVTELLQDDATPERIKDEILPFFIDQKAREKFIERIKIVRETLEVPDSHESSSERIAKAALEMIEGK